MTEMVAVELTRFEKAGGALTKQFHATADGTITNDSSNCRMSNGTAFRLALPSWHAFGSLIETTPRNVAYALGTMRPGLPDSIRIVTKRDPRAAKPGFATRTKGTFCYQEGHLGFVLLDHDTKEMPAAVRDKLTAHGGFCAAIETVCPEMVTTGYIRRRSTSAGVCHPQTGATYHSDGEHVYVLVRDSADVERFLKTFHDRCWLVGLSWHIVGRAGQLLERSIVDVSVYAAERLVFEADPELDQGLVQPPRKAEIHDGEPLETKEACIDLTTTEQADLARLKAAAAGTLDKECEAARRKFVSEQADKAVERGVPRDRSQLMAERWSKGILRPDVWLDFDDEEIGRVTVAAVLADPDRFDGETLADPVEGVPYGYNCAIIQLRPEGVRIFSFAHGGATYELRHDYDSIVAAILAGGKADALNILCRFIFRADLDPTQRKLLCKLAGTRTGAGVRAAENTVGEAASRLRKEAAEATRLKKRATRTKIGMPKPLPDDEAGPVMVLWDDILCSINVPEPPMRNVEGWPIEIQCCETPGLHELTAKGANAEEEEKSRLPAPKNFLLTKLDKFSLEIMIGDYITFVQETENGDRDVAPPDKFLTHYLKYTRSKLSRAHAVVTMPLVLSNGELLVRNGLDHARRAVFRIDPALLDFIPRREACTEEEVVRAYKFLVNEWLVDVATDAAGKCVLIAYALSIIERVLFDSRPTFFVTAGQRGGGKTTALIMVVLAALGVKPAAVAWTNDVEERKKALFSYLREGMPTIIWDNIPRGSFIGCPHIERASTAETYQDRILGITGSAQAPAFTIQAFTGNNIRPTSDQASRSLEARLTTDRPDPENRTFVHTDPIGWTLDHRGEILRALYTILLGNPQIKPGCERELKTRFKAWWKLVGSAVEYAAETCGEVISFKAIFERVEGNDDEAAERADLLQTLYAIAWPVRRRKDEKEFTAADLLKYFDESAKNAAVPGGEPEDIGVIELRRFCTPKRAKSVSPKSITNALRSIIGTPAAVLAGTIALHGWQDRDGLNTFKVELKQHKEAKPEPELFKR